jgi:hypothetical protein
MPDRRRDPTDSEVWEDTRDHCHEIVEGGVSARLIGP